MALRTRTIKKRRLSFLNQATRTPAVYTKLSCFLPWIAEQYGMKFDDNNKDHALDCTHGTGNISDFNADLCRSANIGEEPCIFPFYWNGKLYEQCVFLEEKEFLFPVFRCPVRNITRKIDGINSFVYKDIIRQVFSYRWSRLDTILLRLSKTLDFALLLVKIPTIHLLTLTQT